MTIGPGRWSARSPLERLAATGHGGHTAAVIRRVAEGELIVAQGDEDTHMFIVQSGCVEVRRHVGDQVVMHGRVERGSSSARCRCWSNSPVPPTSSPSKRVSCWSWAPERFCFAFAVTRRWPSRCCRSCRVASET